jgi:hypothetical protein
VDHRRGQVARLLAVQPVISQGICAGPTRVVRRGISGDPTPVVRRVTGVARVVRRVTGVARVVRRVTGVARVVRRVTGVTPVVGRVTGVAPVTGASVRPMHSGAGATRRGVTDLRHGAGERRRRRPGTGRSRTSTGSRRRQSTIGAITSNRYGTRVITGGASGSSESGYRSRRCEPVGRTVAARRRSATARRPIAYRNAGFDGNRGRRRCGFR